MRSWTFRYRDKISPHTNKISDFSVQVRGLGEDTTEQDLIEFYTKKGLQVVDAVLVYAPSQVAIFGYALDKLGERREELKRMGPSK